MALGVVTEIAGRENDSPEDMSRRYTRRYQVFSTIPNEDPLAVRLATGIPQLFSGYPTDGGALVTAVRPRQDTEWPYRWEVEVQWSTLSLTSRSANAARSDPSQRNENPLLRPIRLSFSEESFQVPAVKDVVTGQSIKNTAGDPFDPPPMIDDFRPTFTVRRNESLFNPAIQIVWKNAINQFPFLVYGPNEVKVKSITAESQYENNISFVEVTYTFHVTEPLGSLKSWPGWKLRVLNCGYRELWEGKLVSVMDASGNPVSSPAKLAADGSALPVGDTDVFREFNVYPERDFDELGLF